MQDILACTVDKYTSENMINDQDKTSRTFDFLIFTLVEMYKSDEEKYISVK